jgi:hypothetical protein
MLIPLYIFSWYDIYKHEKCTAINCAGIVFESLIWTFKFLVVENVPFIIFLQFWTLYEFLIEVILFFPFFYLLNNW